MTTDTGDDSAYVAMPARTAQHRNSGHQPFSNNVGSICAVIGNVINMIRETNV